MDATLPQSIKDLDQVISKLQEIITDAKKSRDRLGYFAALYYQVTVEVRDGIAKNRFANGESLARLDVTFARRYFTAYDQWKASKPVSESWKAAFKNAPKPSRLVLQHLLLGMNAHINLDLGVAVVETANGDIDSLRGDYESINTILSSLTYGVLNKLNVVSPLLSVLGFSGTKSNSMLIQFSMGNARDGSWTFAEKLSKETLFSASYQSVIAERDKEIAELGDALTQSSGLLKFGIWLIHVFEKKNVRTIIEILTGYKKLYKKDIELQKK